MSYYQTVSLALLLFSLLFNWLSLKTPERRYYLLISYIFIVLLGVNILYDIFYSEDKTELERYLNIIECIILILFGLSFIYFYYKKQKITKT